MMRVVKASPTPHMMREPATVSSTDRPVVEAMSRNSSWMRAMEMRNPRTISTGTPDS